MAINISIKTDRTGKFIDLYDDADLMRITDYSLMDREVVLNGNTVMLGEKKKRLQVISIDELKEYINTFLQVTSSILLSQNTINYASQYIDSDIIFTASIINDTEQRLLVEQIIIDILFNKYLSESEEMTYSKYARHMSELLDDGSDEDEATDKTRKSIRRSMTQYHQMMKYSQLREELELLGIDPDKYIEYYNPAIKDNPKSKKPKFVWDQLYYNRNLITYRQYRRQLTRSSRNYSYEQILDDLQEYSSFVEKLLPRDNTAPREYFNRAMDFYALETYKRIDFILRLTNIMSRKGLSGVDRVTFFIKRFHPQVLVPYVSGDKINYCHKVKYYRPAIMLEEALLQQIDCGNENYFTNIGIMLIKCQIIRAKVYELLNYHIEFISSDFSGIKAFLQQSYNLCSYHRENEQWQAIISKPWSKMNVATKRQTKEVLNRFISINDALFWPSEKRDIHIPPDE